MNITVTREHFFCEMIKVENPEKVGKVAFLHDFGDPPSRAPLVSQWYSNQGLKD